MTGDLAAELLDAADECMRQRKVLLILRTAIGTANSLAGARKTLTEARMPEELRSAALELLDNLQNGELL